jgi:hypothetical protein
MVDRGVYSDAGEAPYAPSYVRVPGYPVLLAAAYAIFGEASNTAMRVAQAAVDSATCWLVAALAVAWLPAGTAPRSKQRAGLLALLLAALCPFTAIYVTTILSEVWRFGLVTACVLCGTLALRGGGRNSETSLWLAAGLLGGVATMIRPDGALPVAALGATLVSRGAAAEIERRRAGVGSVGGGVAGTVRHGAILSLGFVLALLPWTIRNARVFGIFEPIAPANATMPGEFVPHGYERWLQTWVDDPRYVEPLEWDLDRRRIEIEQVPDRAFDSPAERERVRELLDRYDHPADAAPSAGSEDAEEGEGEAEAPEADAVEMTPAIDAEFAALAAERVARSPLRYYVLLPLERAATLWFDTHSRYYPISGELFPLAALAGRPGRAIGLALFALLTGAYSIVGLAGAWQLARARESRLWLVLLALLVLPRLALLARYPNPEPRYTSEFFLLLSAAAGALAMEGARDPSDGNRCPVAPA